MKQQKKVTISDIAKHAGLSLPTVSRVLSNSGYPVATATREKVLTAAHTLEYDFSTGNSMMVAAVIIPNLMNPFYASLIAGLEYSLRSANMSMLVMNAGGSIELERRLVKEILRGNAKGAILSPVGDEAEHLRELERHNIQMVIVEQSPQIDCSKVSFNYRGGGRMATRYLLERGCETVGFISSPLTKHSRREVFEGYLSALKAYGIKNDDRFVCIAEEEKLIQGTMTEIYEYSNGVASIQKMIDTNALPKGLFCANDMTAIGAIHQLRKSGLRIPEDISVVGFDNIYYSSMTYPPLTTIDQCTYEMGSMAAEILTGNIGDPNRRHISVTLEPRLIIRESVK